METIRCSGIEASDKEELAENHIDDDNDERVTSVETITEMTNLPKWAVFGHAMVKARYSSINLF